MEHCVRLLSKDARLVRDQTIAVYKSPIRQKGSRVPFTPGEAVLLYYKEQKSKLETRWRNPVVVTGHANEFGFTYNLRQVNGKKIRGQFHGDDLRKFPFQRGIPDTSIRGRISRLSDTSEA